MIEGKANKLDSAPEKVPKKARVQASKPTTLLVFTSVHSLGSCGSPGDETRGLDTLGLHSTALVSR
jgi:hypothetical protein